MKKSLNGSDTIKSISLGRKGGIKIRTQTAKLLKRFKHI